MDIVRDRKLRDAVTQLNQAYEMLLETRPADGLNGHVMLGLLSRKVILSAIDEATNLLKEEREFRCQRRIVARDHEDDEGCDLIIELANDCALSLSSPKTEDGLPAVKVWHGNGERFFEDQTAQSFSEWIEVALGRQDRFRDPVCACCGQERPLGPMLHDHIWEQLTNPGDCYLCVGCMQKRSEQRLGRLLTVADLRPCSLNDDLWPKPAGEEKARLMESVRQACSMPMRATSPCPS